MSEDAPAPKRRRRAVAAISDKGADAAPAASRKSSREAELEAQVADLTEQVEMLTKALARKSGR